MLSRTISLVPAFGPFSQNLSPKQNRRSDEGPRSPSVMIIGSRVVVPEYTPHTGLCQQQEVLIGGQDNTVGHVEAVQQNLYTSCVGIVGEKTAQVVQLDHLERRDDSFKITNLKKHPLKIASHL